MYCAIIENDVVNNVIIVETVELAQKLFPNNEVLNTDLIQIGMNWFRENNEWYPPKPFPSWIWNNADKQWIAPVPYPDSNIIYQWNEINQEWDMI
jgi:hypothetical protein